jgi:phage FluMu gp28-like protein
MEFSDENLLSTFLDPVIFLESFIKLETPEGLQSWKMDPYQKHLVRDTSRNRAINKSKKTGISTTIAGESIYKSMTNAGRQIIFVSTGQRIAEELLGKWYDMFSTMPDAIRPHFGRAGHSMQVARLPNGSRVMSLPSADPGNIRGFGLRGPETDVYVDEFAHVANDRELWIVVKDFQAIGGHLTLNSTPKGKRGNYYNIVEPLQTVYRGLGQRENTTWSYHEIPWWQCPRLIPQMKFLKEGMTEIDYKQEYCCEFIDESLSFFPYELIWDCQKVRGWAPVGYKTMNPIYFGIDFGKTTSETVISVIEEYAPESFRILYIEVLPGVSYDEQAETIKILFHEYNPTLIKIDASGPGGQAMKDILSQETYCGNSIEGYDLTATTKEDIIIRLRRLMERKKVEIPAKDMGSISEKLEMQLHGVQRTSTKLGLHTRYSGKEEAGMDDMVWSLALAVYKQFIFDFEPIIEITRDSVMEKLQRERDNFRTEVVREYG